MNTEKVTPAKLAPAPCSEIPRRWLCIPTTPETWIPLGVSPEDFALMLATIDLWKNRISATPAGRDSAPSGDGVPQLDSQNDKDQATANTRL